MNKECEQKHAKLIYYNTWIIYLKRNKTIIRLPLQLFITYRIHNTQGNDKVNTRLGFLEIYLRDSTGTIFQSIRL